MSLTQLLLIGLGGGLGSMGRALIGFWLRGGFPWATLLVNLSGSLLLGFIIGLELSRFALHPTARDFLAVGFCGGFTTFSTFSFQALEQLRLGEWKAALANVLLSVLFGLLLAWAGYRLGRAMAS